MAASVSGIHAEAVVREPCQCHHVAARRCCQRSLEQHAAELAVQVVHGRRLQIRGCERASDKRTVGRRKAELERSARELTGDPVVGGCRRAAAHVERARPVGGAVGKRCRQGVVECARGFRVVRGTIDRQVHGPVEEQGGDVVGMGRRVGLDVLGAVALAVEIELVHAEINADGLEILDGLPSGVERQVCRVGLRLGNAVRRVGLGSERGGGPLGGHVRVGWAGVVRRARVRALDRVREANAALIEEHDVVVRRDRRVESRRVAVRCCDPARTRAAGDRHEDAL